MEATELTKHDVEEKNPLSNKDNVYQSHRADFIHMGAGILARFTTAIIMCPADTIKTRLQFQGSNQQIRHYQNFRHAFGAILREEGVAGFTRGLAPRLLYVIPSAGVSFLCYEKIAKVVKQPEESGGYKSAILPAIAITSARIIGTTVRTPFDVVKQRLQVQGSLPVKTYKNTFQAIRYIWSKEKWRGLFVSIHSAILRDMPFAATYFTTYEVIKSIQRRLLGITNKSNHTEVKKPSTTTTRSRGKKTDELGTVNHLIAGALSGMAATTVTIPFDVIKTRLQTQAILGEKPKYRGVIHAAQTIVAEEGYKGLIRGLSARLTYIAPAAAIIFASYEQYKVVLDRLLPEYDKKME